MPVVSPEAQRLLYNLIAQHDALVSVRDSPDAMTDMNHRQLTKMTQELATLAPVVAAAKRFNDATEDIEGLSELLTDDDPELQAMALDDYGEAVKEAAHAHGALMSSMAPRDPIDDGNAVLEVRPGVGGREASIFAAELFKTYENYARANKFRFEVIDLENNTDGGVRKASANVSGNGAFGRLKFENGVHRVQRIPETESQGRVHTSTSVVAVLPEPSISDLPEVSERDVKVDTFKASGAGGQHVNTTDSAVRLTHIPTGIVIESQAQRSQHKNKALAMKMLRAQIFRELRAKEAQAAQDVKAKMMGDVNGDRSDRIRTYNYPQDRCTDHRSGEDSSVTSVMQGNVDVFFNALEEHDRKQRLELAMANVMADEDVGRKDGS